MHTQTAANTSPCQNSGEVVALAGPLARIKVQRSGSCSTCTCSKIRNFEDEPRQIILARNTVGARPGDHVLVEEPGKSPVKTPLAFIGLCLGGVFGGAILLAWMAPLAHQDLNAGLGSLLGLFCAVMTHKFLVAPRISPTEGLPELVEIIRRRPEPTPPPPLPRDT